MGRGSRFLCSIGLVAALAWPSGADERDPDRPIAQIGERRLVFRDIGCNRKVLELNRDALRGRDVERACAEAEQEEFRLLATAALIEAACAVEKCALTDAEIARFRSPILQDEQALRRLADNARRVPEAVRRVYRGQPLEAVYEEAIKPLNVPLESFRNEVTIYGSLERVEKLLATDFVATLRRRLEERARQQAMLAHLRTRIDALAAAANRSAESAADDYLHALGRRVAVRVFDERFRIPPGREVFR